LYLCIYKESESKREEGTAALLEAKRIEREESERSANLQHQVQMLRLKEREIADVSLQLLFSMLRMLLSLYVFSILFIDSSW
jgi:hypothetical protein